VCVGVDTAKSEALSLGCDYLSKGGCEAWTDE
jgi:hypothetical protein